jgi:hypothetical protein
MSKCLSGLLAVGLTLAALASASAADLTVPTEPPPLAIPNEWSFQATLYGWALSLNGDVGVGRLPDANVDVSFVDLLRHLDGAFMGAFIARNDTFIVGADLIWAKVSADVDLKEGNGPLAPFTRGANVAFDEKITIATGFGGVRPGALRMYPRGQGKRQHEACGNRGPTQEEREGRRRDGPA